MPKIRVTLHTTEPAGNLPEVIDGRSAFVMVVADREDGGIAIGTSQASDGPDMMRMASAMLAHIKREYGDEVFAETIDHARTLRPSARQEG